MAGTSEHKHIFLSYSRDDRRITEILRDNLRALGFNVWIDEEHLRVGTPDWSQAIEDAIREVSALVVVMSPTAKRSQWVNIEIMLAQRGELGIFPVLAYGDPDDAVPAALALHQYADLRGRADFETEFRKLVDGLSAHMGRPVAAYRVSEADGRPVVYVEVSGHVEGSVVVVGRDVGGAVKVAGRDMVEASTQGGPAVEEAVPPTPVAQERSPAPAPGFSLPMLEWVDIPEGSATLKPRMIYQKKRGPFHVTPLKMSKYPITYVQFQVFIDAPDGFYNDQWWAGLAADAQHRSEPGEQRWAVDKHPRENVSWFDAVAFCRWLSSKLEFEVRLPTEWEWQWAAQGEDGRRYPWGNIFDPRHCNTFDGNIRRTTPVDFFPLGASPFWVMDMAGNVREWCLNEYETPSNTSLGGDAERATRGGMYGDLESEIDVRGAFNRLGLDPDARIYWLGFRVAADVRI